MCFCLVSVLQADNRTEDKAIRIKNFIFDATGFVYGLLRKMRHDFLRRPKDSKFVRTFREDTGITCELAAENVRSH